MGDETLADFPEPVPPPLATNLGDAQPCSGFRGPYADGPPAQDLEVEVPRIDKFGFRELQRLVVVYVVLATRIAGAIAMWLARGRVDGIWSAASTGAIDAFERLGPTFVKLGQIMASSPGLFPAPLAVAAERCLDAMRPFETQAACEMIRGDLGRLPEAIFKEFDETPLSAASIGQVHACVLPDGRKAVVKVQRPNIREQMTTDLRISYRLARTMERCFAFARNANAVALIEEMHLVTFGELNPALEAWNQYQFREKIGIFGDNRWVTVPEIYWDYCGPHTICMERMTGIPMDEFDAIRHLGFDGELVLRRGAKSWLEAVTMHGPFHADLHAGNLWVLDDGRTCYLDFGIMGELPPEYRQLVMDLFYTFMFDQDFSRIARDYKNLGLIGEEAGTDLEVGQRLQLVIAPMLGASRTMSLGDFMMSALDMMKQYGMTAPRALILFAKQLLYIERYIKGLAPQWQFATDLFLVKNIFPPEAARKATETGTVFPE
jgi:predicted unusual protein kinase regulating ubiquinone biosynthesis (AarF/ABC1/UbiB family)